MYKRVFDRLPDNYSRRDQVNNKGLHKIIYSEVEELFEVFNAIKFFRNIDNAYGKTLDYIGSNVQQLRDINQGDDQYRLMIKTKIIANLSQGDIETINTVATALIGDNLIKVKETWSDPIYNDDIAGLVLEIDSKTPRVPRAISQVKAAGVKLYYELMYATDYLNVSAREIGYKARYPMAGMAITESKKVDGNRNMLNISESYFKVKNNYLMAGQVSTAAVKNSIEREQIDIKLKAAEGGIKFQMAGMAIAGGAL